jgi:asparagine synthase (glutamine-hydrolysing)
MKSGGEPLVTRYWDATREIANAAANPFTGSASDAAVETERLLRQSLSGQMISDVPLGAFLSGGIDSSTVVALMQAMSTRPVKTFSIGFREQGYDEAPFAKAVAQHLGTDHTELYVTESDALATVPRLASVYSEPFADSSQIPTLLVSELARRHVTVALSGDGGDELFCGYTRYTLGQKTWNRLRHIPAPLRRTIANAVTAAGPEALNRLLRPATNLLPQRYRIERPGDRLVKGASVAALNSLDDVYRVLISHWQAPGDIVIGGREPEHRCAGGLPPDLDPVRRMMHDDLVRYLPDDILAKVDRAAMSVSLETRVPLLDHRLVEFSASLPMHILHHQGQSKWPLRDILFRHVPRLLIERPKMGFGIPLDAWLRGPLRDWAEDLLDETRLKSDGFFRPAPIRKAWIDHLSGARNMHYPLWVILMFQSWLTQERRGTP